MVELTEFRKSENRENVFNGGGRTSGLTDKRRPQLDSACQTGLGNTSHEPSDRRCGGEVCWSGIPKIRKVADVFPRVARTSSPTDNRDHSWIQRIKQV